MFERPHHQSIATVLGCLDVQQLRDHQCYFGGGTAIALRYGEYRESVDIDFLVSDADSFRRLRTLLTATRDMSPILLANQRAVTLPAALRTDQYGLRTRLAVGNASIKFEIVHEGRIAFDPPRTSDAVCGVASLTPTDLIASKLLANSDRWMDDGVFSRDIIDLALMRPGFALLQSGLAKATTAYGIAAADDASRAVTRLRERDGWLQRCMNAMAVSTPPAVVVQQLRTLSKRLARLQSSDSH